MESDQPPSLSQPRGWLLVFGPGAIIASLTIGSGELVFSSRGGALFGYSLLSTFLAVCLLKWALVFATARHLVLTGRHPFERWALLPGPRGWLPAVFFFFAVLCFPIWVAFHAGTVGTLLGSLTGTQGALHGAGPSLWGLLVILLLTWLTLSGNYARLEKVQRLLVGTMLLLVTGSLVALQPDWGQLFAGLFSAPPTAYPEWISQYPEIAQRPVWLELSTYVGVIGGSGFDYLAYVSFLRSKHWGRSDQAPATDAELEVMAKNPRHQDRAWVKAPLIDCSLSFLVVLLFSLVFVACGTEVLRAQASVPSGATLLTLQAQFVSHLGTWFEPIYFAGALLAMLGTLYGTLEVAPATVSEAWRALRGQPVEQAELWRRRCVLALGLAGTLVLLGLITYQITTQQERPELLVRLLTPANLFTGVLSCGVITGLALWSDYRFLPRALRMPFPLQALLLLGCALFLYLGFRAYADLGPVKAVLVMSGTLLLGMAVAVRLSAKH